MRKPLSSARFKKGQHVAVSEVDDPCKPQDEGQAAKRSALFTSTRLSVLRNWLSCIHCRVAELFAFDCVVRDLLLSRGNLKPALGAAARFNSVDLSRVFLPPFTKSMSSLSPRDTLTCPTPNKAWSIQSRGFQFLMRIGFWGSAFAASISATPPRVQNTISG
jgi:hypothetical protein